MTKLWEKNITDASTITHHSPLQIPTHKHQSPRWVTSFPKGDYRSQRMLDSEATHTWEMRFHIHTQTYNFQQHDVAIQATINTYQTSIQHNHNSFENHTCYATKIFNNQHYQLNFSNKLHKATLAFKAQNPSTNSANSITTQAIKTSPFTKTIICKTTTLKFSNQQKIRVKS